MRVGQKQKKSISEFMKLIKRLKRMSDTKSVYDIASRLIDEIQLKDHYCSQDIAEDIDRWENVQELINSIQEYCENSDSKDLQSFLEEVSLLTDIDKWNSNDAAITLMTVHSSKGLEFPLVFIAGMEEGLFPHSNSTNDDNGVEEERRLFYVAVTRAMEELFLFSADSRMKFGSGSIPSLRSRFIDEIPEELIKLNKSKNDNFASKPKNDYTKVEDSFKKGSLVQHKLYGKGMVLGVEGYGENTKVTVLFSGNVKKKFIQKYANLIVVK